MRLQIVSYDINNNILIFLQMMKLFGAILSNYFKIVFSS